VNTIYKWKKENHQFSFILIYLEIVRVNSQCCTGFWK